MKKIEKKVDPQIVEAEENLLIDFQFLIQDLLETKKVSRGELAKKAGLSKSRISQILSAEANPSVRTFARLLHALGTQIAIKPTSAFRDSSATVANSWRVPANQSVLPRRKIFAASAIREWQGACNDNSVAIESDAVKVPLKAA